MEEGGHYYTVYYTSLAVGSKEDLAYRHAVLAQMPDEVGRMDAANMQIKEGSGIREYDFNNVLRSVPINERYGVQYGLHSLPGNQLSQAETSSAFQRRFTTERLMEEDIASLSFGLLLHRLGDSYAHSRIGNEAVMYQVTPDSSFNIGNMGYGRNDYGHLAHGHDPDFAFLRQNLFYSYLQNLYNVLQRKLQQSASSSYRRPDFTPRSYGTVRSNFSEVFARVQRRAEAYDREALVAASRSMRDGPGYIRTATNDIKAKWFIEEIRNSSSRTLQTTMRRYAPENEDATSLRSFLGRHQELNNLDITNDKLTNTIEHMLPNNEGEGLLRAPVPRRARGGN